jgi:hypothetical protein
MAKIRVRRQAGAKGKQDKQRERVGENRYMIKVMSMRDEQGEGEAGRVPLVRENQRLYSYLTSLLDDIKSTLVFNIAYHASAGLKLIR